MNEYRTLGTKVRIIPLFSREAMACMRFVGSLMLPLLEHSCWRASLRSGVSGSAGVRIDLFEPQASRLPL